MQVRDRIKSTFYGYTNKKMNQRENSPLITSLAFEKKENNNNNN